MAPLMQSSRMDVERISSKEVAAANSKNPAKMSLKTRYVTKSISVLIRSFQPAQVVEPFYSGGQVSQARDGTLATTLGEHVLITRSPHTTETLRIAGVLQLVDDSNGRILNL